MSLQETATFEVKVRLSTEAGELPTDIEVERLVADQMGGVLDEGTGLRTIAVFDIRRENEDEPSEGDLFRAMWNYSTTRMI